MDVDDYIGNNRLEDVKWLCSLSESELDMLIYLKELAIRRAKVVGYDELANKFNLKMLRALAFVLMEYLKGQMKDLSDIPSLAKSAAFLDGCNLLSCDLSNTITINDIKECVEISSRKRKAESSTLVGANNGKDRDSKGSNSSMSL